MEAIRQIREVTSGTVSVAIPEAFRQGKVEIIILPLEKAAESGDNGDLDWPSGYFDRVVGSVPDFPDIEYEYTCRQEMEHERTPSWFCRRVVGRGGGFFRRRAVRG